MLVSMKEILDRASKENYAVAAPNVTTEMDSRAAIEAAEELNAPLILNVVRSSIPDLVFLGGYLTNLCKLSKVPIAINLDHGSKYEHAIEAIRGGFTSVMVDRSMLPYGENVAQVKEIVKIAHAVGVSVEAELGHVGQGSDLHDDDVSLLTDPKQAKKFIEDTGIDCLAVAIGTAHGAYNKTPKIHFDLLAEIKKETGNFPLVLHGSSGTGAENIRKACSMGINKVNVANELMQAACIEITSADLSGNGAYDLWFLAKSGYKNKLISLIDLYGSKNKSWIPECQGIKTADYLFRE
ncbi:MAG TPA: class II fructose-bisphosphate aldolase [Clostridiales bacterium]|nr:class II fructose-bisphosphate aldolase [Clostridiales bacterium]